MTSAAFTRESCTVSSDSLAPSAHAKAVELAKHSLRMTTSSGSGHPSTAMALSHIVVELMYRRMKYDPADPWNPNSDRLVLSLGHAVPIVYAAYADLGGAVGARRASDESSSWMTCLICANSRAFWTAIPTPLRGSHSSTRRRDHWGRACPSPRGWQRPPDSTRSTNEFIASSAMANRAKGKSGRRWISSSIIACIQSV